MTITFRDDIDADVLKKKILSKLNNKGCLH